MEKLLKMPKPKKNAVVTIRRFPRVAPGDVFVDDLDEALEVIPFTYSITAYGADYPVDSIVKRMKAKDIVVPRFDWDNSSERSEVVGFQREYVWSRPKADRFIESLLLG